MRFNVLELTDRRAAGRLESVETEMLNGQSYSVTVRLRVAHRHMPGWLRLNDLAGCAVTAVFGHIDDGDVLTAEKGN